MPFREGKNDAGSGKGQVTIFLPCSDHSEPDFFEASGRPMI